MERGGKTPETFLIERQPGVKEIMKKGMEKAPKGMTSLTRNLWVFVNYIKTERKVVHELEKLTSTGRHVSNNPEMIPDEAIPYLIGISHKPISLETVVHDDSGTTLGETIPDWGAGVEQTAIERVSNGELCEVLRDALNDRELQVIDQRYGKDALFKHIGKSLGISATSAQNAHNNALGKLRVKFEIPEEDRSTS